MMRFGTKIPYLGNKSREDEPSRPDEVPIAGYTDRLSARPGDTVRFYLSTPRYVLDAPEHARFYSNTDDEDEQEEKEKEKEEEKEEEELVGKDSSNNKGSSNSNDNGNSNSTDNSNSNVDDDDNDNDNDNDNDDDDNDEKMKVRARLTRIVRSDPNPITGGIEEFEESRHFPERTILVGHQPVPGGSSAETRSDLSVEPHPPRDPVEDQELTVRLWFCPTLVHAERNGHDHEAWSLPPCAKRRKLSGGSHRTKAFRDEPVQNVWSWGTDLRLDLLPTGNLSLVYDKDGRKVSLTHSRVLGERRWYHVVAVLKLAPSLIASGRSVALHLSVHDVDKGGNTDRHWHEMHGASFPGDSPMKAFLPSGPFCLGRNGSLNGRLENPSVSQTLGHNSNTSQSNSNSNTDENENEEEITIAAWDFSCVPSGAGGGGDLWTIPSCAKRTGRGPRAKNSEHHGHALVLHHHPTRGVRGHRWDGSDFCWRHRPDHYSAIHFHDDDVYDFGWEPSMEWTVPEGIPSGVYVMRFEPKDPTVLFDPQWEEALPLFICAPRETTAGTGDEATQSEAAPLEEKEEDKQEQKVNEEDKEQIREEDKEEEKEQIREEENEEDKEQNREEDKEEDKEQINEKDKEQIREEDKEQIREEDKELIKEDKEEEDEKTPKPKERRLVLLIPTFTYIMYGNHARPEFEAEAWTDRTTKASPEGAYPFNPSLYPAYGLSTYNTHSDGTGIHFASHRRPLFNMRPGFITFGRPGDFSKHAETRGTRTKTNGNETDEDDAPSAPNCSGLRHFPADAHILDWLGFEGFEFDIITDHELHSEGVEALDRYTTLITATHPEYHTEESLNALQRFRDEKGGNIIYLGGNGFYWKIAAAPVSPGGGSGGDARSNPSSPYPDLLEIRRSEGGVRTWASEPGEYYNFLDGGSYGGLWRNAGRPPNDLVGIGFCAQGGFVGKPYYRSCWDRSDITKWVFHGLSLSQTECFGDFGLSGGGAAGYELDRVDPSDPRVKDGTIVVLASSAPPPGDGAEPASGGRSGNGLSLVPEEVLTPWTNKAGIPNEDASRADMVYFRVPESGAQVFSVGSITFCGCLPVNEYENPVCTILRNVVERFHEYEEGVDPTKPPPGLFDSC